MANRLTLFSKNRLAWLVNSPRFPALLATRQGEAVGSVLIIASELVTRDETERVRFSPLEKKAPELMAVNVKLLSADYWIDLLQLARHPEGGYYREVYRADETVGPEALPARYGGARTLGTSIYFLLRAGEPSRFHRLQSDEVWHYYAGDPVVIHLIERGEHRKKTLGPNYANEQAFVQIIPRHTWFGAAVETAAVEKPDGFVLLGCTVAPGFEFPDFELARREDLLKQFPQLVTLIHELT